MKKIKLIIFDYDGVICNSVSVKTDAFIELYKSLKPNQLEVLKKYHLDNGGISRYEKIKYFEKLFFNKEIDVRELNSKAHQFSKLVKKKVIDSDFLPGVISFVKNCNKRGIYTFICTGTPHYEILEILESQGIKNLFNDVFGSPESKISIIKRILKKYNFTNLECLFVGDAMTDHKAAKETNVNFIGIKNSETTFPSNTTLISNFNDKKFLQLFK